MNLNSFSFSISGGVGHIQLNQPERGNPMDFDFCREFRELAIECSENPQIRAVLIDAKGPYFSVGGDVKTMIKDRKTLSSSVKRGCGDLHIAISRLARMDAPVVVAAHALVVGGGVGLVAAADIALCTMDCTFYAGFSAIGYSFDTGVSWYMPRRVGSRRATEFYLRNQKWSAQQAMEYGLVSHAVDSDMLAKEARNLAEELAVGPTLAYGEMKRLLLSSSNAPLEMQLEDEIGAVARCARTEDSWTALNAVLKKERISFQGK